VLRIPKTKALRALAVVAVLVVLYALAGFVLAPKLLRAALLNDIPASLGVTPAVGDIRINPLRLQLTVANFALAQPGGEKLLGFDRLFVDFEISSLWHRAYSFGHIELTAPYVNARVAQDGSLNLMRLNPSTAAAPKPRDASGSLPPVRIGVFKISQGLVSYEDDSRADVFAARLEPIDFELREFTTGAEGGQFTFAGSTKLGERIEWRGHVSVQPMESDGEFRVGGLLAHTLWQYLEDKLHFEVDSGSVDLAATYRLSAGNDMAGRRPANLEVNLSEALLRDLAVRPKDSGTDWITVPVLRVTGGTLDLAKRQAHVDLVSVTGLKLLTWLEPDGSLNLMKLVPPETTSGGPAAAAGNGSAAAAGKEPAAAAGKEPAAAASNASAAAASNASAAAAGKEPAAAAGDAPSAAPSPPWLVDLRRFELRTASVSLEDRSVRPAVKVLLAPFDVQVDGASQDLRKPVEVTLDTRINEAGALAIVGEVTPQPVAADLRLKLSDIELAAVQPYIARYSSMTLLGGRLGGEARLHYDAQKNPPAAQFSGNIEVEKLHTVDNALHDDFINWDRLDILGLNYTQGPDRLAIEKIVVRKPYARVIVESDESLNVKRVLTVPGGAAHGTRQAARGTQAAAPAPNSETLPISVKQVAIEAGQANFADLSVTPNFSTAIEGLEGSITGLSSKARARSKVNLHGSVGAYAPVAIVGEFNVLGPKLYTDIGMTFRNLELTVFNPYSGKFAGYDISKGKLTTDLHYLVDGRKLDAQHHIVVDQLEFGDKTVSKDAVSLPIKLAVALLKDRNGVIDLNLPVTGSLDDPQFRLGPLVWKVFVHILERAVTAPFALLGSLFGAGPDVQFIEFQPGMSSLDPAAADKVKTVAKALVERPQLKIEVPIAVVPDIDRPALIAARFDAEVGAAQAAKGGATKAGAGAPPAYEQLDPAARLELLTRLYSKDFGAEPNYPKAVSGLKKPDSVAAKIDYLEKAVREHIRVEDGDLQTLGQQRALALQQVLLDGAPVGADRVFLVANDKATSKEGRVQLELSLR
jgi:hypothetical protein